MMDPFALRDTLRALAAQADLDAMALHAEAQFASGREAKAALLARTHFFSGVAEGLDRAARLVMGQEV